MRDTALEVMSFLAALSDNLRSRLGAAHGCIAILTRLAIATAAGGRVDHQVCSLPVVCHRHRRHRRRHCCLLFWCCCLRSGMAVSVAGDVIVGVTL